MTLLQHVFYRADGESCHTRLARLRRSVYADSSQQARRLAEHLEFCKATVPMYRDISLCGDDPFESLRGVAVFDKQRLSALSPQTLSVEAQPGCRMDSTSGTSGQTFRFMISRPELCIRKEHELLANEMLGLAPSERYLQIWGGHESASPTQRIKNAAYGLLTGRTLRTVRGPDRNSLAGCVSEVGKHAGGVLLTYPSILYGLCEIDDLAETLKTYRAIILTGEAVDYDLFAQFGLRANLRNRYGSREFGVIALADAGAMHYFGGRYVLETHPTHGLLVTDLAKKAMPMLRYPIGDFVDASDSRPNSSDDIERLTHLGSVEGRTFDVLEGRSGRRYAGTFWTLVLRKRIHVEKFRLRLGANFQLRVDYVGDMPVEDVTEQLHDALEGDFDLVVSQVDQMPELLNAKQKIVSWDT